MSYLNLYIDNIILSSINNKLKITSFTILFNSINTISLDNIVLKIFDTSTITSEYLPIDKNSYYISNITSNSCVINFFTNYELLPSDIIKIEITDLLDLQGNLLKDEVTISLCQLFYENKSTTFFYQLPDIVGNYKILLTEVNEQNVSNKYISSNIFDIVKPISSGTLSNNNIIDKQTTTSFEFRTEQVSDTDNNPISANFTTILQIKIN